MENLYEVCELVCNDIKGAVAYMNEVYEAYPEQKHAEALIEKVEEFVNGREYTVFGGGFEEELFVLKVDDEYYSVYEPGFCNIVINEH